LRIEDEVFRAVTPPLNGNRKKSRFCEEDGVDSAGDFDRLLRTVPNKFKPEQCTCTPDGVLLPPPLRSDILEECENVFRVFRLFCMAHHLLP